MPKTVLITGCSSPQGIGFATARELARAGCSVHATVRDRSNVPALLEGAGYGLIGGLEQVRLERARSLRRTSSVRWR